MISSYKKPVQMGLDRAVEKKIHLLEDKISAVVEKIETKQLGLFSGLNTSLINKAKHAAVERITAAANKTDRAGY